MSKPPAGKYFIVSRLVSLSGRSLAINYNGQGNLLTVAEFDKSLTQVWTIIDNKNADIQSVSPLNAPNLEIIWKDGFFIVDTIRGNVWAIRQNGGITTFQDSALKVFWGLENAINEEPVSYGPRTGNDKQTWVLIPAI